MAASPSNNTKTTKRGRSKEFLASIGFKPGKRGVDKTIDPNINRKGTPVRNMKELRKRIQQWLNEPTSANRTRLDDLLEQMSKNKGDKILEFGIGKVPDQVNIAGELGVEVAFYIPSNKRSKLMEQGDVIDAEDAGDDA